MAGFLYFAPNHSSPITGSAAIPPDWGVGHFKLGAILAGESLTYGDMPSGPNGERGIMFCLGGRGTKLRYSPDQIWRPVKSEGAEQVHYLVGIDPEQRPDAESLLRKKNLGGTAVELGGQDWDIPILHVPFDEMSSLSSVPRTMTIDADGSFRLRAVSEYDAVCERVAEFDRKCKNGAIGLPFNECFDFFVDVLATNYHVGPAEVAMLEVFSTDARAFLKVFQEVFGMSEIERIVARKKEGSDSDGPS
ncbi:MAG: hypothetical protein EB060_08685 [Proteobacteria bacterium]|nr:hypothetical protein [Pseudomonadota bacterium]